MTMVNHNYGTLLGFLFATSIVVLIYQIGVLTTYQPVKLLTKPPPVPPKDYWIQLWRPHELNSHNDRILEQRRWIQHMASKTFWNSLPQKNILVFDVNSSYYDTNNGNIICHGKHNLKNKCKITKRKSVDTAFRKLRKFDAIVTPHNWIYLGEIRIPYPSMKHILYVLESPSFTSEIDLNENNIILASYSSDSDIPIPYGKWLHNEPSILTGNSTGENYAKGKTKLIAMFVSNCNDKNGRLKYAQELNKYIPVDIYGACGSLNCSMSNEENCFSMLKEHYKFYLAFENSNCRDYITEKLFRNALLNNVIPIVMGAHPDDYRSRAPENSYIHVENFDSPLSLAKYLKRLHENDTLYNQYFKWKGSGHLIDTTSDFFCRVCGMLYYSDYHHPPLWQKGSTYKNTYTCLSEGQWYWDK